MTPTPHANPEIAALEAQWWNDWWAADYSWDGLKARPAEFRDDFGSADIQEAWLSLQDYWRDEESHLISEPGTSRRWTRWHCPFVFADGTHSPKSLWSESDWQGLYSTTLARLSPDRRSCLLLSGCVLKHIAIDDGFANPSQIVSADHAYIAGHIRLQTKMALAVLDASRAWLDDLIFMSGTARVEQVLLDDAVLAGRLLAIGATVHDMSCKKARVLGTVMATRADIAYAQFHDTRFGGHTDFSETVFTNNADFTAARFGGPVDFFGCRFHGRALFDNVQCLDDIGFYKAAFVRRLTMNDAVFYGKVNLEGATDGDPIAQSAQAIRLTADTAAATLAGTLDASAGPPERSYKSLPKLFARRAVFYEDANFSNRDQLSPSTFRQATFHERALFHGSDVHASVNFHGASFRKALQYSPGHPPKYPDALLKLAFAADAVATSFAVWKKAYIRERIQRRGVEFTADAYFDGLETSFRTLKQMMEERRDRVREGEFFNLELRARRKRNDVPWWERVASFVYWAISDYGNSIFRPLVMLLSLYTAMAAAYYGLGTLPAFGGAPMALPAGSEISHVFSALVFSLQNVFSPFSVLDASKFNSADPWVAKVILSDNPGFSLLVKLLATTQSLLTLTLAFLAGLAGRRRFQIN